jgi:hypothetical protein
MEPLRQKVHMPVAMPRIGVGTAIENATQEIVMKMERR